MVSAASSQPLAGQVALITGASRGIGAALAKLLAAQGAHVVLAARTVGGLEAVDDAIRAQGGVATLVPLDVAQHELIDALAATLYERFGKLDIVVGNAGMLGTLTPVAHADPKLWAKVLDVNLTANYRLIRACDPLLRLSQAGGRAVFVTASEAQVAKPYWGMVAASKAGLEQLVAVYAQEVAASGVSVQLFDPIAVRTAMRAQAFPGEDASALPSADDAAQRLLEMLLQPPANPALAKQA
jgi:NAD(P)-dependent dehydrogenase (short-subunit alcohol dehydrogenase family)